MKYDQSTIRTLWTQPEKPGQVFTYDQRKLPFFNEIVTLQSLDDCARAIANMVVRGAPLIGATAAYGLYLGAYHFVGGDSTPFKVFMEEGERKLMSTRPTAVNLRWALEAARKIWSPLVDQRDKATEALEKFASQLCDDDAAICSAIGDFGLELIRNVWEQKETTINILTHCNAGRLACIEWGTATAPIYKAHRSGLPVHVWVDETRPRNQGARLTMYELMEAGVPCTLITDNAGGLLMQQGKVDMCIVGTDRTTSNGDVVNKIGTYLKALAAQHNGIPFYVALPTTTIDWTEGMTGSDVPIEDRDADEILIVEGLKQNDYSGVLISVNGASVCNPGFDVTPAELVTGLITEYGVYDAGKASLQQLKIRL